MERGLEASCEGTEVVPEVLLSERVCWRGLLLLGALSGVEAVLTIGGRGRLEMDELCCEACWVIGTDGADAVLFSSRGGGTAVGCCRSGFEALGSIGELEKPYGDTGEVDVCPL